MASESGTRAFKKAEALQGPARQAYLAAMKDVSPDVYEEVASLLGGLDKNQALVEEKVHSSPFPRISGYEIVRELGRGGMGVVYEARQKSLNRPVAIKTLIADSDDAVERFKREASILATLNHPNITSVYDFGTSDGMFWISMEYAKGTTLEKITLPGYDGLINPYDCDDGFISMLKALEYIHRNEILHRDLKPANIIITAEKFLLADFGISIADTTFSSRITRTGNHMGTAAFASPEQIRGDHLDQRSDIYSLGICHYFMVTKKLPRWPVGSENIKFAKHYVDYFNRMFHPDINSRFQSARDAITYLKTALPIHTKYESDE